MRRSEASEICDYCREHQLPVPEVVQARPQSFYLLWRIEPIHEDLPLTQFLATNPKAAKHALRYMEIEREGGQPLTFHNVQPKE